MNLTFKITFNAPAFKMFFDGEDPDGLSIEIVNVDGQERVRFKPVKRGDAEAERSDFVPISERFRGGAETWIEGSRAEHLSKLLSNPLHYHYFTLVRREGGWLEAEPHMGPGDTPKRWLPWLRVWRRAARKDVQEALGALPDALPVEQTDLLREKLLLVKAQVGTFGSASFGEVLQALQKLGPMIEDLKGEVQEAALAEAAEVLRSRTSRESSGHAGAEKIEAEQASSNTKPSTQPVTPLPAPAARRRPNPVEPGPSKPQSRHVPRRLALFTNP